MPTAISVIRGFVHFIGSPRVMTRAGEDLLRLPNKIGQKMESFNAALARMSP
jgi:hypothetical protein